MLITAVIITKNEENNIKRCLESLKWVDEIVLVDSMSGDMTISIAKNFKARIFLKRWQGYASQKNYAISRAKGEWILSIDADEEVTEGLRKEILEKIRSGADKNGYMIPFKTVYYGKWLKYGGLYPDLHLRLFKKNMGSFEESEVHEALCVKGKIGIMDNGICHYTAKHIFEHIETINKYTDLEAIRNINRGYVPTGYSVLIKPVFNFIKLYFLKFGFMDGIQGLVYQILSAFYIFLKEVKTLEKSGFKNSRLLNTILLKAKKQAD
jgi:glycosyltransferase involved in cell wall biosynthesis